MMGKILPRKPERPNARGVEQASPRELLLEIPTPNARQVVPRGEEACVDPSIPTTRVDEYEACAHELACQLPNISVRAASSTDTARRHSQ
ncbi:hypothetical protein ACLOJK_023653 [Asimina triloba]